MTQISFSPKYDSSESIILPLFKEAYDSSTRKPFTDLSRTQTRAVRLALKNNTLPSSGFLPIFTSEGMVFVFLIGKEKELDKRTARENGEQIFSLAKKYKTENISVSKGSLWKNQELWESFCEGIFLGTYEFKSYKGKKYEEKKEKSGEKEVLSITLLQEKNDKKLSSLKNIATGVAITKDLINTPPSVATPSFVEEFANTKFKGIKNIKISSVKEKDLKKLGAGGILGVGQASSEESRFLVIEYTGVAKESPLALIGKGVTYDTGGLSLKPSQYMKGMKQDLGGCATVLGGMYTIAANGLKKNVVAVTPLAENLVSRDAYKPDDVLTMLNGKTVEITNTDAEGRLLLADALSYTEKTFKPKAIVDLATLTGACSYAVGDDFTAGLSTDKKLFTSLKTSSENTDEPVWELPLHSRYEKHIESKIADLVNSASKLKPGTIEGGLFLKNFVTKKTPWCHLDIASVAFNDATEMATGRNVRLLYDFAKHY